MLREVQNRLRQAEEAAIARADRERRVGHVRVQRFKAELAALELQNVRAAVRNARLREPRAVAAELPASGLEELERARAEYVSLVEEAYPAWRDDLLRARAAALSARRARAGERFADELAAGARSADAERYAEEQLRLAEMDAHTRQLVRASLGVQTAGRAEAHAAALHGASAEWASRAATVLSQQLQLGLSAMRVDAAVGALTEQLADKADGTAHSSASAASRACRSRPGTAAAVALRPRTADGMGASDGLSDAARGEEACASALLSAAHAIAAAAASTVAARVSAGAGEDPRLRVAAADIARARSTEPAELGEDGGREADGEGPVEQLDPLRMAASQVARAAADARSSGAPLAGALVAEGSAPRRAGAAGLPACSVAVTACGAEPAHGAREASAARAAGAALVSPPPVPTAAGEGEGREAAGARSQPPLSLHAAGQVRARAALARRNAREPEPAGLTRAYRAAPVSRLLLFPTALSSPRPNPLQANASPRAQPESAVPPAKAPHLDLAGGPAAGLAPSPGGGASGGTRSEGGHSTASSSPASEPRPSRQLSSPVPLSPAAANPAAAAGKRPSEQPSVALSTTGPDRSADVGIAGSGRGFGEGARAAEERERADALGAGAGGSGSDDDDNSDASSTEALWAASTAVATPSVGSEQAGGWGSAHSASNSSCALSSVRAAESAGARSRADGEGARGSLSRPGSSEGLGRSAALSVALGQRHYDSDSDDADEDTPSALGVAQRRPSPLSAGALSARPAPLAASTPALAGSARPAAGSDDDEFDF